MDTAIYKAVPKTYISNEIKLDFFNNSNLKNDIQNRISDNLEKQFIEALNNIQGDNKENFGISFSEITLLALAYFFKEIFKDKTEDNLFTIETVKGILDSNNLTQYTEIHELIYTYHELNEAKYFNHCWLIIQTAWFFNSKYFGSHQHIDFLNHYIKTGEKLPIKNYCFDKDYLDKKYNDIDNAKEKLIPINGYSLVNQWHFYILYLVCNELNLNVSNFKTTHKDFRIYNPLTKTSRQLRPLTPFKIFECDIKSAFPTFIDIEAKATLKDNVYNNLMKSKNITRSEAKILFNKVCNSGKYKTKEQTEQFFIECGYTLEQSKHIITLTHDFDRKFFSHMTEYEAMAIYCFTTDNNIKKYSRLHDAIICIDTKEKPSKLFIDSNCDFGYKELNRPKKNNSFFMSSKRLPYAYINSIPKGLSLTKKHEPIKPNIKGTYNGFNIYECKFQYTDASFNLNCYFELQEYLNTDYDFFINQCYTMLYTLETLNKRQLKPFELEIILKHIRSKSNFVFSLKTIYSILVKENINKNLSIKERDFDYFGNDTFKKNIDFLKSYNEARMNVNINNNLNDVFMLLSERINNNDFYFITENIVFKGRKINNLLAREIINKFNYLCTGMTRKKRHENKCNTLYNTTIKSVTFKSLSLKPQQRNAFIKKKVSLYEKQIKMLPNLNDLLKKREQAKQLYVLLCTLLGHENEFEKLEINNEVQDILKHELIQEILKIEINNIEAGVNCFNFLYKPFISDEVKPLTNLENIFETDLTNCIFNNISTEDAYYKGEQFFKEYEKFHDIEKKQTIKEPIEIELIKPKFQNLYIDFDNL
jgi:hypothetical protein